MDRDFDCGLLVGAPAFVSSFDPGLEICGLAIPGVSARRCRLHAELLEAAAAAAVDRGTLANGYPRNTHHAQVLTWQDDFAGSGENEKCDFGSGHPSQSVVECFLSPGRVRKFQSNHQVTEARWPQL